MDTSVIFVDISSLYPVLISALGLLAVSWGVSKVVQLLRKQR